MHFSQLLFVTLVTVLAGNCLGDFVIKHVRSGLCVYNYKRVVHLHTCPKGYGATGLKWFWKGKQISNRANTDEALYVDVDNFHPAGPGDNTITRVLIGKPTGGSNFEWKYEDKFLKNLWKIEEYALQVQPITYKCNVLLDSIGKREEKIGAKSALYPNLFDHKSMEFEFIQV